MTITLVAVVLLTVSSSSFVSAVSTLTPPQRLSQQQAQVGGALHFPAGFGAPFATTWLCLEFCGANTSTIDNHLSLLKNRTRQLNAVSFEHFGIGPGGRLIRSNVTNVVPRLRQMGFRTIAQISGFPYPPGWINYMRQLFASPAPFIAALVGNLTLDRIDGVNVDFEYGNSTQEDATKYAAFLRLLRKVLGRHGKFVSVDFARWAPMWDPPSLINHAMASSAVSDVLGSTVTMNTYAAGSALFQREMVFSNATFEHRTWTAGLLAQSLNATGVEGHFAALKHYKVCRIAVWRWPVEDYWWPLLDKWRSDCESNASS